MIHGILASFFRPGGPYLYVRLVTAAYALCALGRLIPVKRKQVPGYRSRVLAVARVRGGARHRARRPGRQDRGARAGYPGPSRRGYRDGPSGYGIQRPR